MRRLHDIEPEISSPFDGPISFGSWLTVSSSFAPIANTIVRAPASGAAWFNWNTQYEYRMEYDQTIGTVSHYHIAPITRNT